MKKNRGFIHIFLLFLFFIFLLIFIGYFAIKDNSLIFTSKKDVVPLEKTFPVQKVSDTPQAQDVSSNDCAWAILTTANVEFLITSPSGKHTGFNKENNTYLLEMPDSSYGPEQGIGADDGSGSKMPDMMYFDQNHPEFGLYKLQVIGKNDNKYQLHFSLFCEAGKSITKDIDSIIRNNGVESYLITLPQGKIEKD
jgi:hypothetical protein